ncbi:T9SS type B sorting domain-containing protein [Flavobacterium sp.]|uniref:Ig-like domain-containing protein n=1 Tax=Flavobacterium sp. TaxID=239 RepID=UPI00120C467F|nr:T9SS type B sorting domain-containing protein [Flavobacterium sp.]RZJ71372.1 MAG: T9SS type B sorting domain-containing protein [Flavobacterium sp.]
MDAFSQGNIPPTLSAVGFNAYCPGTPNKIVNNMTITDPDDIGTIAIYVQISVGYQNGTDLLTLTGNHPTISTTWNTSTGKLTMTSAVAGQLVTYAQFESAIEDIVFSSSAANPSGNRTFSITAGNANYLPSTGHYYQFIPNLNIKWTDARVAAQNMTYYGLQGYLATIGAADEAALCGEQSSGTGWIGGSDSETEGVWKWMTGPEAGTIFWNGVANGSTPNYANWNNGEPNNFDEEDYAHITAPGVGIYGSWNDLGDEGGGGDYVPKGFIVEYGGMPGDPILNISATTSMVIQSISATTGATGCGSSSLTLSAQAQNGSVTWYDAATGGNIVATGSNFTTPILNQTTIFFASAYDVGCTTGTRNPVTATINDIPTITSTTNAASCEGSVTISATASSGTINWYTTATGGNSIATGNSFTTPVLNQSTTYYAEVLSNSCPGARVAVDVTIYPIPQVQDEPNVGICENGSAILDAGITGVSYLWSTGQTSQQIAVFGQGVFTVTVTTPAPANCSATKTFTVLQKNIPEIIGAVLYGNELTILTSNSGDFEYSLDGVNWQNSPVFVISGSDITTLYAQSIHGCGGDDFPYTKTIVIPDYFTPNTDGFHDLWTVNGMIFYPKASTQIYDRFGKFIKTLNRESLFWDGTYNGKALPSDDYWFVFESGTQIPTIRGHFSLKR